MVAWLGAMQAQDFAGAKWSLGQRLWPASDAAIEDAFNAGEFLRTHVLRPTWHFVAPEDIRWMLALTAPRVHQTNAGMYRQVGMDPAGLSRSLDVLVKSLEGGKSLTRDELRERLQASGIEVDSGLRMAYVMMNAELDGIVCSGPRRGKQFTYMLLDERVPVARTLARDEALAELVRRYFRSHGPATAHDFARWSSLTLADTREGIGSVRHEFNEVTSDGQVYWFAGDEPPPVKPSPAAYLLSIYDEFTIGYKDSSAIAGDSTAARLRAMGNALQNVIILDGRIAGTWRREIKQASLVIDLDPFRSLTDAEAAAVVAVARQCGEFFGLPTQMSDHG